MRDILYDVILIGLIVISAGGYFFYRDAQANRLSHMESLVAAHNAPATICTRNYGTFQGASTATLYVHNGRIVFDGKVASGGSASERFRVLIEKDGTHFVDPDTMDTLPLSSMSVQQQAVGIDDLIISGQWNCSPWWIPDDSVFNIPKPVIE